jgi:hypothetical protein
MSEIDKILDLKSPVVSPVGAASTQDLAGSMIQKRNGVIVFIGIVFLVVALFIGVSVVAAVYYEVSGVNDRVLQSAVIRDEAVWSNQSLLQKGLRPDAHSSSSEEIETRNNLARISAVWAIGSLILSGVLLSLKGRFCSECGSGVGTATAKLCGSCGVRFKSVDKQG